MKEAKHLFSKVCILIATFLASAVPAEAQDFVYSIPAISPPAECIIREWKQAKQYVVYSHDGTSHFSVVDPVSNSFHDLTTNGPDAHVNDFVIVDNHLYFCGLSVAGPIFGMFEIQPAIDGAGLLTIVPVGVSIPNCIEFTTKYTITDLLKLEVKKGASGLHAYMIGECHGYEEYRTVVDLCFDDSNWKIDLIAEPGGVFHYDDIAITQDKIVVVGHKHGSHAQYMTAFDDPDISGFPILRCSSNPLTYYFSDAAGTGYEPFPYKDFLIEHLDGDKFAVVGYAQCGYADYGAVLSIYDGPSNLVFRGYISQGVADSNLWQLNDLRYDASSNTLYLLQDMHDPASMMTASVICEFMLDPNLQYVTGTDAYLVPNRMFTSMDTYLPKGGVITAGPNGIPFIWHHDQTPINHCPIQIPLPFQGLPSRDFWDTYGPVIAETSLRP
ncbi:MAG: hypothetical protein IJ745_06435, partial [Bacteroidales bacterium]|nr:hypothetical protein [Bacteroidales bacterium]